MKRQTLGKISFCLVLIIVILQGVATFMDQPLKEILFFINLFLAIVLIVIYVIDFLIKKNSKY